MPRRPFRLAVTLAALASVAFAHGVLKDHREGFTQRELVAHEHCDAWLSDHVGRGFHLALPARYTVTKSGVTIEGSLKHLTHEQIDSKAKCFVNNAFKVTMSLPAPAAATQLKLRAARLDREAAARREAEWRRYQGVVIERFHCPEGFANTMTFMITGVNQTGRELDDVELVAEARSGGDVLLVRRSAGTLPPARPGERFVFEGSILLPSGYSVVECFFTLMDRNGKRVPHAFNY